MNSGVNSHSMNFGEAKNLRNSRLKEMVMILNSLIALPKNSLRINGVDDIPSQCCHREDYPLLVSEPPGKNEVG